MKEETHQDRRSGAGEIVCTIISAKSKRSDVTQSLKKAQAFSVFKIGQRGMKLFPHEFMGNLEKEGDMAPQKGWLDGLF